MKKEKEGSRKVGSTMKKVNKYFTISAVSLMLCFLIFGAFFFDGTLKERLTMLGIGIPALLGFGFVSYKFANLFAPINEEILKSFKKRPKRTDK